MITPLFPAKQPRLPVEAITEKKLVKTSIAETIKFTLNNSHHHTQGKWHMLAWFSPSCAGVGGPSCPSLERSPCPFCPQTPTPGT